MTTHDLARLFARRAEEHSARECLIAGSRRFNYRQVDASAAALAGASASDSTIRIPVATMSTRFMVLNSQDVDDWD